MKREIIITGDGSSTIHMPEWNEQYHSKHGAIQEAKHVFIKSGLELFSNTNVNILEIGFGTGLNSFITLLEAPKLNLKVNYTGVEAYPVEKSEIEKLNYVEELSASKFQKEFDVLHTSNWEEEIKISEEFILKKEQKFFKEIDTKDYFNLIYFDAFGARVQPELWTEEIFEKMYASLKEGGVLVTYSAKGSVRRAMQAVGFKVERLAGPPGKREMLRAIK
ncbi:tRNA U34 5-methylaminomethyl-2-thiouridine-forming methyltransferase MnmC [Lutibacter oricola]|uniref:tRNA U34 5-methylaminomethyl-2-thiouridine-forming methyltransferase MnmC n=1 Tax=Lutibacter oricola TaxID=762486 RepID=A0A1H2U1J5_9FLAO|nr:tRNA (5-methylaminomethyl-2-thiouridine)(34)-methyltransferase MnmD [Lutibacter oricola]SDW50102.1 tRNA U34 5-methylaminomethyl-2-thiouridine-forming methyltransferase MnmC [Lutibacter oricola]